MKYTLLVFMTLFVARANAADLGSATAQSCPTATELTEQKMQLYGLSQDQDMLAAAKTYLAQAKRCHELATAQGTPDSRRSAKEAYLRGQASALVTATGSAPLQ